MTDTYRECMAKIAAAAYGYLDGEGEGDNTINSALARTDWKLLAQQKQALARLARPPAPKLLLGLLSWLDAIQDAAEAEGYPVEFLAE